MNFEKKYAKLTTDKYQKLRLEYYDIKKKLESDSNVKCRLELELRLEELKDILRL